MMLSMSERPGGLTVKSRQARASPAPSTIFQFIFSRTGAMCNPMAGMSPAVLKKLGLMGFGFGFFTHLKCLLFTMFSYQYKKAFQK